MTILSTRTTFATWLAFLGLICGVLDSVGGLAIDLLTIGLNWGTLLAFGALVGMPLIFGTFGFFIGALIALIARVGDSALHRMRR